MSKKIKPILNMNNFMKPRKINIVDLILLVLIIIAFYYPAKINPWYKIREAYDLADSAYSLASESFELSEENNNNLDYHEIFDH